MLAQFVANNDQLEAGKLPFLLERGFQRRKGFNDANHVLVWADTPGIKQEVLIDQVTFGEHLAVLLGCVSAQKAFIDCVVDHLDAAGGNAEDFFNLTFGEL